jgi:hypothetical protein
LITASLNQRRSRSRSKSAGDPQKTNWGFEKFPLWPQPFGWPYQDARSVPDGRAPERRPDPGLPFPPPTRPDPPDFWFDPPRADPYYAPPAPPLIPASSPLLYAGWKLRKATGEDHGTRQRIRTASWKISVVTPLNFSKEELHLQVIGFMAQNAKRKRTLQDAYDGLRTQSQRDVITVLIDREDRRLQVWHPHLQWKLAALRAKPRKITYLATDIAFMIVVMKTEPRLFPGRGVGPPPWSPVRPPPLPLPPLDVIYVDKDGRRRPSSWERPPTSPPTFQSGRISDPPPYTRLSPPPPSGDRPFLTYMDMAGRLGPTAPPPPPPPQAMPIPIPPESASQSYQPQASTKISAGLGPGASFGRTSHQQQEAESSTARPSSKLAFETTAPQHQGPRVSSTRPNARVSFEERYDQDRPPRASAGRSSHRQSVPPVYSDESTGRHSHLDESSRRRSSTFIDTDGDMDAAVEELLAGWEETLDLAEARSTTRSRSEGHRMSTARPPS